MLGDATALLQDAVTQAAADSDRKIAQLATSVDAIRVGFSEQLAQLQTAAIGELTRLREGFASREAQSRMRRQRRVDKLHSDEFSGDEASASHADAPRIAGTGTLPFVKRRKIIKPRTKFSQRKL